MKQIVNDTNYMQDGMTIFQTILDVLVAAGTIASAVVACIALRKTKKLQQEIDRRDQKRETLKAFNKLQKEVLDPLLCYTEKQVMDISQNPRDPEYKTLSGWAARCEHLAVGAREGVYDRDVITKLAGNHLYYQYRKLKPIIERQRNINGNEMAYSAFRELAESMKK